jgi:O-antigen ligase
MPGEPRLLNRLKWAYFLAIGALVPVIKPALPMGTSIFDYFNTFFIGIFIFYLLIYRKHELPLIRPLLFILFGSLTSMLNSRFLVVNLTTLVQELYLFMFLAVLYNVLDSERDLLTLVRFWFLAAAVEGLLLLKDVIAEPTLRAEGTFDNPNMASCYLGMSMFLVLFPIFPSARLVKLAMWAAVVCGMIATKSISALLASAVAGTALASAYWFRAGARMRVRFALVALVVVVTGGAMLGQVLGTHNFADRLPGSAEGRSVLWKAGIESFLANPLGIGVGPAGFEQVYVVSGGSFQGTRRKELHSDYLSFMAERGIIGITGLLFFVGAVWLLLRRSARLVRSQEQFLMVLGLSGMFIFALVDAVSHEVFHYRHLWLALSLIAAQWKLLRRASAPA